MTLEDTQAIQSGTMVKEEDIEDTQIVALIPAIFFRVQEPDGSDSVYDIEILAQSPGATY